jgi:hypothetical protein
MRRILQIRGFLRDPSSAKEFDDNDSDVKIISFWKDFQNSSASHFDCYRAAGHSMISLFPNDGLRTFSALQFRVRLPLKEISIINISDNWEQRDARNWRSDEQNFPSPEGSKATHRRNIVSWIKSCRRYETFHSTSKIQRLLSNDPSINLSISTISNDKTFDGRDNDCVCVLLAKREIHCNALSSEQESDCYFGDWHSDMRKYHELRQNRRESQNRKSGKGIAICDIVIDIRMQI